MENENYTKAINLLTSQEKFHICLGLERVSQVLELLGNPQERLNIIHVAGTNGKGSTCAILSAVLTAAGFKTGLYTSPHILEYTERIKINGRDILQSDFADLIFEVSKLAKENNIYLTEFEILTVCAYKYFADRDTDICIIETGLGGRLDATSVISKNILSVITSIIIIVGIRMLGFAEIESEDGFVESDVDPARLIELSVYSAVIADKNRQTVRIS